MGSNASQLVGYRMMLASGAKTPAYGALFNYVLGADGVFISAKRPGLEVCMAIGDCEIRGLALVENRIVFTLPRVPPGLVRMMLGHARSACIRHGSPIEALFHVIWLEDKALWQLVVPEQTATSVAVRPLDDSASSSYGRAIIEVHSHHQMEAYFSGTDDADEQGFRIYGVLGEIFTNPKLLVRVGCYGYFQEVPADQVFEMPDGLSDN